ncbi:SMI1/KNR4 family protein [Radiobacillus sp. PE A8.2]|uniref:SMI1/KNR4 family protein n=1 Tax=Radiobacillus sp. PE A8.2 TaxID=3380349 RepID=UPI00389106FC
MDYNVLRKRIDVISKSVKKLGGDVPDLVIGKQATMQQIARMERKLGVALPTSFRKVLLEFSADLNFRWFLPDDVHMDEELIDATSGSVHWNLEMMELFEEQRKSWIKEVFPNPDDEYDKVWHDKLAFYAVSNGDLIAFDLSDNDGAVVYLSHEDGEGHGYKLGENFIDFINKWSRIAFVGGEDWIWLPFASESGFVADDEVAERFRKMLDFDN